MADFQKAFIGLGSNLGDSWGELRCAVDALTRLANTRSVRCSDLYRSAPWGVGPQPDFLNAVCSLETCLGPPQLLEQLLEIERARGRERMHPGAPRTLDLDLLLYGAWSGNAPGLTVPHPRMHLRAFVLQPLADLEPTLVVPGMGPVSTLLARCRAQRLEWLGPVFPEARPVCRP